VAFDVPALQLIAYSSLTGASIIVASVSVFLAFRQNFGWRPIVMPTSYGGGGSNSEIEIEFEVWNRRKYPIMVLAQELTFKTLTFVKENRALTDEELGTEWTRNGRTFQLSKKILLDPNSHHRFSLAAEYKTDKPERVWDEIASIKVYIFDPNKNRELLIGSGKVKWSTMRGIF
jgi:hypothetical protein